MHQKPSVILISIDSLRYDCVSWAPARPHMESLGIAGPPATPHLDALMDGAFCFTQAVANAPYTTSSHASILTGLLPPEHGVRAFMKTSLAPGVATLPELLGQAGYRTLLMTDGPQILTPAGLALGFEQVLSDPHQALDWWSCHDGSPRLMLLHYLDVHMPYGFVKGPVDQELNSRWLERKRAMLAPAVETASRNGGFDYTRFKKQLRRLHRGLVEGDRGPRLGLEWYLDGLEWFDAHRLRAVVERLDGLGAWDESIVVVLGDHGEGDDISSRYHLGHACLMFDDVIRVPLAVRPPGAARRGSGPQLLGGQCSLADVTPTVLDLVGELGRWQGSRHPWSGRSLAGWSGGKADAERAAYAEYWSRLQHPGSRHMEWTLRHRIVRTPEKKLSLIGRCVSGLAQWAGLSPEAFAERMYEDVMGRRADPVELARRARWARFGGRIGRLIQYHRMRISPEARQLPKLCTHDLMHDPLERSPRDRWDAPDEAAWVAATVEEMESLDESAAPGGPLLIRSDEQPLVEARLAELGYLD